MTPNHENGSGRSPGSGRPPSDASGSETPTVPAEYSGRWVAWDVRRRNILAVADTYTELMDQFPGDAADEVVVERAPGLHTAVAARTFSLLDDESPDVIDDVRKTIPDADEWLDSPNVRLWLQKPRDLIGTEKECYIRYILRGIRDGIFS